MSIKAWIDLINMQFNQSSVKVGANKEPSDPGYALYIAPGSVLK